MVSHMKHPEGAGFATPTDGWMGIRELLAELWVSQELGGLCLRHRAGGNDTTLPWRALGWVLGV